MFLSFYVSAVQMSAKINFFDETAFISIRRGLRQFITKCCELALLLIENELSAANERLS
jgi:hypothetical protein